MNFIDELFLPDIPFEKKLKNVEEILSHIHTIDVFKDHEFSEYPDDEYIKGENRLREFFVHIAVSRSKNQIISKSLWEKFCFRDYIENGETDLN